MASNKLDTSLIDAQLEGSRGKIWLTLASVAAGAAILAATINSFVPERKYFIGTHIGPNYVESPGQRTDVFREGLTGREFHLKNSTSMTNFSSEPYTVVYGQNLWGRLLQEQNLISATPLRRESD